MDFLQINLSSHFYFSYSDMNKRKYRCYYDNYEEWNSTKSGGRLTLYDPGKIKIIIQSSRELSENFEKKNTILKSFSSIQNVFLYEKNMLKVIAFQYNIFN